MQPYVSEKSSEDTLLESKFPRPRDIARTKNLINWRVYFSQLLDKDFGRKTLITVE